MKIILYSFGYFFNLYLANINQLKILTTKYTKTIHIVYYYNINQLI